MICDMDDNTKFQESFQLMLEAEKMISTIKLAMEDQGQSKILSSLDVEWSELIGAFEEGRKNMRFLRSNEAKPFFDKALQRGEALILKFDSLPPRVDYSAVEFEEDYVEFEEAPLDRRWWGDGDKWRWRIPLTIGNLGEVKRGDLPITLNLAEIPDHNRYNWETLRVVDQSVSSGEASSGHRELPYQLEGDELIFQVDLPPRGKKKVYLYLSDSEVPAVKYKSELSAIQKDGSVVLENRYFKWDLLRGDKGLAFKGEEERWIGSKEYLKWCAIEEGELKEPRKIMIEGVEVGPVRASALLRAKFENFAAYAKVQIYAGSRLIHINYWGDRTIDSGKMLLTWCFALHPEGTRYFVSGMFNRPASEFEEDETIGFLPTDAHLFWNDRTVQVITSRMVALAEMFEDKTVAYVYDNWDLYQKVRRGGIESHIRKDDIVQYELPPSDQIWLGNKERQGIGGILPVDDHPRCGYILFSYKGLEDIERVQQELKYLPISVPGEWERRCGKKVAVSPRVLDLLRLDKQREDIELSSLGEEAEVKISVAGELDGVELELSTSELKLAANSATEVSLYATVTGEQPAGTKQETTMKIEVEGDSIDIPLTFTWYKPIYYNWIPFSNYLYAAFRDEWLSHLMDRTYLPCLTPYKRFPEGKYDFASTGLTMELIAKDAPHIYSLLYELIARGQIIIDINTYSPDTSWFLPEGLYRLALEKSLSTVARYYSFLPKGCWPPEVMMMPSEPDTLQSVGFDYYVGFNTYRPLTVLKGIDGGGILSAGEKTDLIPINSLIGVWTREVIKSKEEALEYFEKLEKWLLEQPRDHFYYNGGMIDTEGAYRIAEQVLTWTLEAIRELPYVRCSTMIDYINKFSPVEEKKADWIYVCGNGFIHSGSPQDLELNAQNQRFYEKMFAIEKLLDISGDEVESPFLYSLYAKAWHELFLISSTETRGYSPSPARVYYGYQRTIRGELYADTLLNLLTAKYMRSRYLQPGWRMKRKNDDKQIVLLETEGLTREGEAFEVKIEFEEGKYIRDSFKLVREDGVVVEHQLEDIERYAEGTIKSATLVFLAEVPHDSHRTYFLVHGENKEEDNSLKWYEDTLTAENEFLTLRFDPERGGLITSLIDKQSGKEVIAEGGVMSRTFMYANELDKYLTDQYSKGQVALLTSGPVRIRVLSEADITIDPSLNEGSEASPVEVKRRSIFTLYKGKDFVEVDTKLIFDGAISVGDRTDKTIDRDKLKEVAEVMDRTVEEVINSITERFGPGGHHLSVGEVDLAEEYSGEEIIHGMPASDKHTWTRKITKFPSDYEFLGWENWFAVKRDDKSKFGMMSQGMVSVMHHSKAYFDDNLILGFDGGHNTKQGTHGEDERHGGWKKVYPFRYRYCPVERDIEELRTTARKWNHPLTVVSLPYISELEDGQATVTNPSPHKIENLTLECLWVDDEDNLLDSESLRIESIASQESVSLGYGVSKPDIINLRCKRTLLDQLIV